MRPSETYWGAARKGAGGALLIAGINICAPGVIADVKPGLTVEGGLSAASNPLLVRGSDRGSAIVDAAIKPSMTFTDATGLEVELSSILAMRQYSHRFEDLTHGNVQLTADWRKNEWISVLARTRIDREPMVDRLATDIDASIGSAGVREGRIGSLSVIWHPDARTRIQPELTVENGRYPTVTNLRDTDSTLLTLHATRRTSPYTTLGARIGQSWNKVDAAPNSHVLSTYVTLDQRLSTTWLVRTEMGLEHIRTSTFQLTPSASRTQAAGRIELCHEAQRLTACASGALASEVSGLGGLQRRFDMAGSVRWRLTPRLNLGFEGRYQRASQQRSRLPNLDSAQARLRLDRRVNRRLTASAVAEYRRREPPDGRALSSTVVGIQLQYEPLPL
ncbi:hypothetical protein DM806_09155 [Sphingobium lactosutens]|uniref:hypothetical protein n=1 Tax=Sphingobium lactosutens TaxID=522773 RepID=UPI0015BEDCD7|nr:hypothetical protein [Sphingobium lactosutens]NWK95841.1 hypothetical protein [Sphingobium lactosutens]